jgi:hypothetical protein
MPDIDAKLADALKQARSKPMYFAFVAKGAADGVLIISKNKVPGKEIAEAKAKVGGGAVLSGRCLGEDGQTVFETDKDPPATLAGQLRKIALRDAGLALNVVTRVAGDLEEGESTKDAATDIPPPPPLETPSPKAPPPPDAAKLAAQFKDLLKAVTPVYLQAAKAAPDMKPALDALVAQATGAAKAGEFKQATVHLTTLTRTAKAILAAPPPSPKPDAATEPPKSPAPETKPDKHPEKPAAPEVSFVALQQCRLAWDKARDQLHEEIEELQNAIVDASKNDPAGPIIAKMVRRFDKLRTPEATLEALTAAGDDEALLNRVVKYQVDLAQVKLALKLPNLVPILDALDANNVALAYIEASGTCTQVGKLWLNEGVATTQSAANLAAKYGDLVLQGLASYTTTPVPNGNLRLGPLNAGFDLGIDRNGAITQKYMLHCTIKTIISGKLVDFVHWYPADA